MVTEDLKNKCVSTKFVPSLLTEDTKKKTVFDRVPQFEGKVQNYPQFLFKVMIEDEIWLFRNQS